MKKKTTEAVLAANRANGKKSPGPRTPEGKANSKMSALIHGFFAGELLLSDEDKRLLETLRRTLARQLLPVSVLQNVAFAAIVTCIGRCKLALRQEMHSVSKMFGELAAQQTQPEQPDGPVAATEWYLSGKQGLREGMRLLEAVKQEFLSLGRIDQKWNAGLDAAFGPQLRQLLTQWMPSNESAALVAYQLAEQLTEHAKLYGGSLPFSKQEPASEGGAEKVPKVILDPQQNKHMVIKLFELEGSLLSDLWKSSEQRASDSARAQHDVVDFAPRYFTTACRDLRSVVDWYMRLKKEDL